MQPSIDGTDRQTDAYATTEYAALEERGWLGNGVVSVLDSGAEGPGLFKSQSQRCQVTDSVATVGCHYFPPGLQLPPQPLRGLLPILLLGEQRHNGCEQFCLRLLPESVATAIWTRAFCAWVQHANHSTTEPPSFQWGDEELGRMNGVSWRLQNGKLNPHNARLALSTWTYTYIFIRGSDKHAVYTQVANRAPRPHSRGPIYKISYDLAYDYRTFVEDRLTTVT